VTVLFPPRLLYFLTHSFQLILCALLWQFIPTFNIWCFYQNSIVVHHVSHIHTNGVF
jgi:hypothetical protein